MKRFVIVFPVLVAAVVLALGGLNAVAAQVIGSVSIVDFVEPVVGESPYYGWSTAESEGFYCSMAGAGSLWLESEDGTNYIVMESGEDEPVFKEGYRYRFQTEFTAEGGYVWNALKPDVTINGKKVSTVNFSGSTLTVRQNYGPLVKKETLKAELSIDGVAEPAPGENPVYSFNTVKIAGLEQTEANWLESADGNEYTPLSKTGGSSPVFKETYYYRFEVTYNIKDGYVWDAAAKPTVNGEPANVSFTANAVTVSKDFGMVEILIQYVPSVEIKGVVAPASGEKPGTAVIFGEGSGVYAVECSWYESLDGGANFRKMDPADDLDVFYGDGIYRISVVAAPEEGYAFDPAAEATVLGKKADAELLTDYSAEAGTVLKITYTFDKLSHDEVTVIPGASLFSSDEPGTPVEATVSVTGAKAGFTVKWYLCDESGTKLSEESVAEGLSVQLPGIEEENKNVTFYALAVVSEPKRETPSAEAVVPYVLNITEDNKEKITVSFAEGSERVTAADPDQKTNVSAMIKGAGEGLSVYWYLCDSEGNADRSTPYAEGFEAELPAFTPEEDGTVLIFEIYAVDERGEDYSGTFRFEYVADFENGGDPGETSTPEPSETEPASETPTAIEPETLTPTETPTETPEPTDIPTATPEDKPTETPEETETEETPEPETTKEPESSGDPGKTENKSDSMMPLAIVLISVAFVLSIGAVGVIGYFLGVKGVFRKK